MTNPPEIILDRFTMKTPPDAGTIVEIEHDNGFRQRATWDGKDFLIPGTEHKIYGKVKCWRETN
jgi:hypothetical protein